MDVIAALGLLAAGAAGAAGAAVVLELRRAAKPPAEPAPGEAGVSLAAVLDALPAGAVLLGPDDAVRLANRAAGRMRVATAGRLDVPAVQRLVRDARRARAPRGGRVELPGARIVDVSAAPRGDVVVVLFDDVTEAHRVEAVRRDFVANVSHELKTPVGGLTLLAEAMLDAAEDPPTVRRFAERMLHESHRLSRLVQELIDLSRLQGADPIAGGTLVDVGQVVDEAVDRVRLAAEAGGIAIAPSYDGGLRVVGDEAQLVTAVANLLDNAVNYSAPGTRVGVTGRERDGEIEITVTDQGIGIAPEDTERIFERFYRADPARSRATGGTGLGLAIVKHAVANHGGRVAVWSVVGTGSTFTLYLPAAKSREVVQR